MGYQGYDTSRKASVADGLDIFDSAKANAKIDARNISLIYVYIRDTIVDFGRIKPILSISILVATPVARKEGPSRLYVKLL